MDRNEIRFRVTRAVQPRLNAFLSLRGIQTQGAVEDIIGVRDRKYLAGQTGFEFRATRQVSVLGSYDYAWQEFEGEPSDAASNAVMFSLVYEPRRQD